ncbi:ATP synthase F1 subunit delta [Aureibacter tunicatorum]|uniref:ATP synthase subunit delta n=1 Tax=Aureibacter tunicatorum TaxID=866807 RepID=A0AAE4BQR1_9BACT|nr:ATP synthase F1 subunit delta [Aureibacter tunicatorum]MDR6237193.1 F-type H+-transporting ATPase subunit delta [Aureibacter tunicatorum]BDD06185.1 ATP synthase subunit delta [Aureibacter tunicatorum]
MADFRVATRYAKALVDLATEKNSLDKVYEDVRLINDVCAENESLVVILKNPIVDNEKKQAVLEKLFNGKVSEITTVFLRLIASKKRADILPAIMESFVSLYYQTKNIASASIQTTFPLTEEMRNAFVDAAKQHTGAQQIELEEIVAPEIIGGYVFKIDDRQIDASVKTKLSTIKRSLTK